MYTIYHYNPYVRIDVTLSWHKGVVFRSPLVIHCLPLFPP